jgi:hypothetical protein
MSWGHTRRLVWVACLALLALVASGCLSTGSDSGSPDSYEALRGIVLNPGELSPRAAMVGDSFSLPRTAPAYTLEPGRTEDLRALADRYAGKPVTEGLGPNFSPDLTSFDTGDGWFVAVIDAANSATSNGGGWTWYEAAWRNQTVYHPVPMTQGPCPAPPDARTERATLAFFERVGVPVELVRPDSWQCVGDLTIVVVSPLVDGLPVIGGFSSAWVDRSGTVVQAEGSLQRLTPIGEVELAPAGEVLRRLVQGDARVAGNCTADCTLRTDDARLALVYATNGGSGGHDHIPGGVVDEPASRLLVPAVLAPGDASITGSLPAVSYSGALAISSALLVDDPAQAEAARRADATSTDPAATGPTCTADSAEYPVLAVCTSRTQPSAGVPVLLTAVGERYEPVGADGCEPLFALDPGDGTGPQSFLPRSGTLITARVAHTYAEPGTYTVVVRSASRCSTPASPGGSEPEFDLTAQITVTVTE